MYTHVHIYMYVYYAHAICTYVYVLFDGRVSLMHTPELRDLERLHGW